MARTRQYFIDHLRYLSEWGVVAFHVAVGYAGLPEFYVETETSDGLMVVRHAVSLFTLPLLFLVAGYFTLHSLKRLGTVGFMRLRLLRLGLPFLVGIILLGPLMPYLGYYAQSFKGLETASYWEFWYRYLADGLTAWTRPVVFTTHSGFHHQHFYFLPLLLQILLGFVLVRALWRRWSSPATWTDERPGQGATLAFLAVAILVPVLHFLASRLPGAADVVAFLLFYSFSDFLLMGGAFLLGVYAYHRHWFTAAGQPGWWTVALLAGVLFLLHQGSSLLHAYRSDPAPGLVLLEQGLAASFTTWLLIAVLLFISSRFMNRPSAFGQDMAAASYHIYLLQYPVILILRFPLLTWEASAWLKFLLVTPATILICWVLSRFLIRPRPRLSVALLGLLTAILFATGVPRWGDSHLLLDRRAALTLVVPEPESGQRMDLDLPVLGDGDVQVAWLEGRLYVGHATAGVFALSPGQPARQLSDQPVSALAATPEGTLLAISNGDIVSIDPRDGSQEVSLSGNPDRGNPDRGRAQHLAPVPGGGYFFTALDTQGSGRLYFVIGGGAARAIDLGPDIRQPSGLAFHAGTRRLLVNDARSMGIWSVTVAPNGAVSSPMKFAELFRGDRRYGHDRHQPVPSTAGAMTMAADGHLLVASRPGVQVFDPQGNLLGLVSFPELLPTAYYPPHPIDVAVNGQTGDALYVAVGESVYTVPITMPGVSD